jgi:hypothetical protein
MEHPPGSGALQCLTYVVTERRAEGKFVSLSAAREALNKPVDFKSGPILETT